MANVSSAIGGALDAAGAVFVNGERRAVVRTPTLHWNASLGPRHSPENVLGFVYSDGDIDPRWSLAPENVARWRVAAFHSWNKAYHRVRSITPSNRTIKFVGPAQFGYGDYTYCSLYRWYVENVPEMLLHPGSGTWRSSATSLYYAPTADEDPSTMVVTVPVVERVLSVEGAHNVSISNLVVTETSGVPDCGVSSKPRGACDADLAGMAEGAVGIERGATGVTLHNFSATRVGGYGIKAKNAPALEVQRSSFRSCGAGGLFVASSPFSVINNSFVAGYGERYPAGVGVAMSNGQHATVSHCDVSGGLYNGLVYGGDEDAGAFTVFEMNHVHGNGRETDDGICDFGAIHGSNPGSREPIFIRSNVFHNITAFQNGGAGIYMDAGSVGLDVSRNLVYGVTATPLLWNGGPMPGKPVPSPNSSGVTRVHNNVFVADRDSAYYRRRAGLSAEANPLVRWNGVSTGRMELNVFIANTTAAPSRQAWYNGQPCAQDFAPPLPADCTWDLADNFVRSGSVVNRNVYFNTTGPGGATGRTFPGGCSHTAQGPCGGPGGRSAFNNGCACASLAQWSEAGFDRESLAVDPQLRGALRLVTAPSAIAMGIEPLSELARVGPDWRLD